MALSSLFPRKEAERMISIDNNQITHAPVSPAIKPQVQHPDHAVSKEKTKEKASHKSIEKEKELLKLREKDIRKDKDDSDTKEEDVLVETDFGDTLMISGKGKEVLKTKVESLDEDVQEDKDDEDQEAQAPTSFAGISDSQMKEMYLKGEISRYQYETEIEQRKELREQDEARKDENNRSVNAFLRKEDEIAQTADAVKNAYKTDSAKIPDAKKRLDMLNSAKGNVPKAEEEHSKKDAQEKVVKISVR